mgnify:CR=1 FL=1
MKFIRKNILTAVFFSVFAILLGGALISCSNGSSSSDEDGDESSYGTKIYSESVTFSKTPTQIVSTETLADLSIKSLTIKVINVNYSGSDDWWFTACSDSSWSNGAKLEWQSGEDAKSLYLATITDAAAIATYKANGIYIAGIDSATASVSVFYIEGEAEESNDSGSEEALIKSFTSNTGSSSFTISSTYQLLAKYETVSSASKVTIKITNVSYTGTSSDSWWFASGTDTNSYKQKLEWKEGDSYELEISAISEYSKGIYLGGLEGLTGTVTVSYE